MTGKTLMVLAPVVALLACSEPAETPLGLGDAQMSKTAAGGRPGAGTVFVTSQGLYYDSFVSAESLPPNGRFQQLENGETEFGPGDRGYLGGRWWVDTNGNDIQDADDAYFLCPLLGPGRTAP